MKHQMQTVGRNVLNQPETNILIFAFLLNFPWEFLQAPLFKEMTDATHWEAVKVCTRATIGDAAIMLIAYSSVAAGGLNRWWFKKPRWLEMTAFIALGVIITIAIEYLATRTEHWAGAWEYSTSMPTLPFLGTGLTPLLQWILLPPIAIWFVRRQLSSGIT